MKIQPFLHFFLQKTTFFFHVTIVISMLSMKSVARGMNIVQQPIPNQNGRRFLHHIVKRDTQQCDLLQQYHETGYNVNSASICPWENELKSERGQYYYEAKCLCERPSSNYVNADNIWCEKVYKSIKFEKITCVNGCRIEYIEKEVSVACIPVLK